MAVEFDDTGLKVIGNNVEALRFYDSDRVLQATIYLDANNRLNIGDLAISTDGTDDGSPSLDLADVPFLTLGGSSLLNTERVIAMGNGLQAVDGGADGNYTVSIKLDGATLAVSASGIKIANGTAQYQIPVTGASPYAPAYTALSTFAGSGLVFSSGVFAVGAGAGITVNADDVALTTPGSLTASSTNSASGNHTHAIDSTIARAAITITAGAGLTGGGDLSTNRTLTVGAGAGITVNADDVALTTPGSLTASSTNSASGNHTHAIDSTIARAAITITAGAGLTGGGDLSANRTIDVGAGAGITVNANDVALTTPGTLSESSSNTASGNHTHAITASSNPGAAASLLKTDGSGGVTVQNLGVSNRVTTSLIPTTTDTYDLGSSTLLWRKGWLAELDAVLFAQNTITLLGGWFIVGKDEGVLPADVSSGATTVNFGKAMTVGHFVLFRAAGAVEYMTVGSLVSGTTYNVTRNVDGSGANAWPAGSVFMVLGASGDGRIELNAYDTPRLSMIRQGATYNAQTELVRLGDLNGSYGIVAETYGIGLGDYSAGNYMRYDQSNGFIIKSGAGNVIIDSNGVTFSTVAEPSNYILFKDGGTGNISSRIFSSYTSGTSTLHLAANYDSLSTNLGIAKLSARNGSGAATELSVISSNTVNYVNISNGGLLVGSGGVPSVGKISTNEIAVGATAWTFAGGNGTITAELGYYAGDTGDVRLYRSAADMWLTPDGLTVSLGLNVGSATSAATGEVRASVGFAARVNGSSGGLFAGSASDVQWYRGASNVWQTSDGVTSDTGFNAGFSSPVPAYGLVRAAIGVSAYIDGNSGGIYAGASEDVQLYRNAANVWRTPDSLMVDVAIGIGTTAVPHGAVGAAMFAIEGPNASTSGPHMQFTTASDDYPIAQHLHFSHDNWNIAIDSYYDGAWKSSKNSANFLFNKDATRVMLQADTGITAGSAITWDAIFAWQNDGKVSIGTLSPTLSDGIGLDINGKLLRLRTSKTPASASATGNAGEICWDSSYIYVCTATNTWKRAAIATW